MQENYKELLKNLQDLKNNYFATGLKLELETEIISTQEIDLAKNLAIESGLELTLKTSGCSAVSDIFLTEAFDIKNILTPMIESSYALEKFYNNVKNICTTQKHLSFNIETITAIKNIDGIFSYKNIDKFSSVVFGRNDFCHSLNKSSNYCDNEEIFENIKIILKKIENTNLNLTIGGNITKNSIVFLNNINNKKFKKVETRKIIFDKKILEKDFENALKKALDFEILWLESKSFKNPLDIERTKELKKRILK